MTTADPIPLEDPLDDAARIAAGADATRRVFVLVYDELKGLAHRQLARKGGAAQLCTTELVHEAWMRLGGSGEAVSRGRAYFFGAAALAMRQLLVDRARAHLAQKRGGAFARVTWDDEIAVSAASAEELLGLHDALTRLEAAHPRVGKVVECRYFAGLSVEETAEAMGVSARTVKADFAFARAWLYRELGHAERP